MVLIIDNYDSFTYNLVHLVAQGTDDLQVHRNDTLSLEDIESMMPSGILISPGPGRPAEAGITCDVIRTFGGRIPLLGVCLGHQAIGEVYGGDVTYASRLMHGKTSEVHHDGMGVFTGVSNPCVATRYHSLVIDPATIPSVLSVSARSEDGTIMGVRHETGLVEGIQFHPESLLTEEGPRMIANWMSTLTIQAA